MMYKRAYLSIVAITLFFLIFVSAISITSSGITFQYGFNLPTFKITYIIKKITNIENSIRK